MQDVARRSRTAVCISSRAAVLVVLAAALFVVSGITSASATGDTDPPVLVAEQFAPTTIDTSVDTSVTVTVHATDDLSGVDDMEACFQSPSHLQTLCGASTQPTSGTANDGVYDIPIAFPQHREVGSWSLGHVLLRDAAGNIRYEYQTELDQNALPTQLRVDDGPSLPDAPTGAFAIGGDAEATVTWIAPDFDGGSPITGYTVTPSIGGTPQPGETFDGPSTNATVTGLTNGTTYTFEVAAVTHAGTSVESDPSNAATPATVPGAPEIGGATRGNSQASVWWTAPASNGGAAITGYTVTPIIGATPQTAQTFLDPATTETVTGLTNGTAYSFRVAAVNRVGTGPQSDYSNIVTPANRPPQADAGPDQTVHSQANFTLQGTGSSDPDGDPLRYAWTRLQGPQVTITNATTATATVTGIKGPATLVFRLTVTDPAGHSSTDDVTVTVSPK